MFPLQTLRISPDKFPKREEQRQKSNREKDPDPIQKTDAAIKGAIDRAVWKDDVLRELDYEINIYVKNGAVYLNGHIQNAASKRRIENIIRDIPNIMEIKNNLVLDDALTLEVAASLEEIERTYDCKFFIGASYGAVSLNGVVSAENIKLLAEKRAASNPNVRGVINNTRVSGANLGLHSQPFWQPTIGESIYFLDGISGVVKQVIINPNNRRVIAMTVQGKFIDQRQDLKSLSSGKAQIAERALILRMSAVRYLTRVSGFLYISSYEKDEYIDFDPSYFTAPDKNWKPPYPYCAEDVLFPVEYQNEEAPIAVTPHRLPTAVIAEDVSFRKQFVANDSFGGYDEE